jgi:hypothetical protein
MRHAGLCAILLLVGLTPSPPEATAQTAPDVYHGRSGDLRVRIPLVPVALAPQIDGSIQEAAWEQAALLTGFSQFTPLDQRPASDSTEVWLLYTPTDLYVGVRAFDARGGINATLADRDRITGDDRVEIILDTFNDRRRAFLFAVNPFGVQADGTLADATDTRARGGGDGRDIDYSPDFVWESRGRLTPEGYEVELRIPFKSLRFQSDAVQSWGINVVRHVQRTGESHTWTPVERTAPSFLGQSGLLADLAGFERGLVLDVNPVMTARRDGLRLPDGGWSTGATDPDLGLNLRWGITANLTANGTFNPDFSQVESDVGQPVYDPRSAVFFPEKRPFFLDASELYEVPNRLIYTRRVVQPVGAAKLSGTVSGTSVGFLSALDDAAHSLSGDERPLINMLRVRRDVGTQSTLGWVYTDRQVGGDWSRTTGVDMRLVFGGAYTLSGQLAGSYTRSGDEAQYGRPLFDVQLARSSREWSGNASLRGVHPEFRADAGFINRFGIAQGRAAVRKHYYPGGAIQSIQVGTLLDGNWTWDRFRAGTEPNDIKWHITGNASLRGGWRTNGFIFIESFKYPDDLYRNYFIERRDANGLVADTVPYVGTDRLPNRGVLLSVATPQFPRFAADLMVAGGKDDNFEEWSSAWVAITTLNMDWRPTDKVRLNFRHLEQRYHRYSDGSMVKVQWIPRARLEYQVSRSVFVRLVGEHNALKRDALRDDSRTNDPILIRRPDGTFARATAISRGRFRGDALFSYQPTPGTVLFLGYGSTLTGDAFFAPQDLERRDGGWFLKLSYLFRT